MIDVIAVSSTGLLRRFSEAGVLDWADVHPAQHLCFLYGERDEHVMLASALAVRALRSGSLCVDLASVQRDAPRWGSVDDASDAGPEPVALTPEEWPDVSEWLTRVAASPAVTRGDGGGQPRPFRLVDGLLYLERYWQDQETVRRLLLVRLGAGVATVPLVAPADDSAADQDAAVASALSSPLTVIAGGPGTGKTHVIARIVRTLTDRSLRQAPSPDAPVLVALAAPTGKAAARMSDSLRVEGLEVGRHGIPEASTIHRLLGWTPGSRTRFRHDGNNPLPHDLVIVDELSMVSTTLMARLLAALKPQARLVLVGDPDQLASVEAGAVLADLTSAAALAPTVVRLRRNFRFAGAIQRLATAIRLGDADVVLATLDAGNTDARLLSPADAAEELRRSCVSTGEAVFRAASRADAPAALRALDSHRLLCAHRRGPFGVEHWSRTVTGWLVDDVPGYSAAAEFHVGRPLLVTRNVADLGLFNGDSGVVLAAPGQPEAAFATASGVRRLSPYLLDGLQTLHAMTIHKSQGSQFRRVSVVLPPVDSPLLTRELLYTAVTRACDEVLLVGTEEAVRAAVSRPAARTSGLVARLDG